MNKSILVPLDGTPFSEEALPTAIRLARSSGGQLLLARVVDRVVPSILLTSVWAEESWSETPADSAERYLADISTRIAATTGVNCRIAVLHGAIASALRKEAARIQCDLIVMSTHGHGALGRVLQSSTADRLARSVACPVLLVRATGGRRAWNIHRRYLHVLVPLDGSPASESAAEVALNIANLDRARITLLHVAEQQLAYVSGAASPFAFEQMPDRPEPEEEERMGREYLGAVAQRIRSARTQPIVDIQFISGDPAHEIAEFADDQGVDLIAMATRGERGLRRFVLGSTTTSVLHNGHTDILIIPPNANR